VLANSTILTRVTFDTVPDLVWVRPLDSFKLSSSIAKGLCRL
jgi:hypothetical protein